MHLFSRFGYASHHQRYIRHGLAIPPQSQPSGLGRDSDYVVQKLIEPIWDLIIRQSLEHQSDETKVEFRCGME